MCDDDRKIVRGLSGDMKSVEFAMGNPVITLMDMIGAGYEFEAVEMDRCEKKWYFNENGEYVRDDKA